MFCCAVLILVLGLCRAVWVFLRGSVRGSEPGFAPPARRPAPGPGRPGSDRRGPDQGGSPMSVNLSAGPTTGPTAAAR